MSIPVLRKFRDFTLTGTEFSIEWDGMVDIGVVFVTSFMPDWVSFKS